MKEEAHDEFERLYREEGDRLWRALVGYSGDPDIASDAVAEAFAQALSGRDRIRSPSAWIWHVAFRIASGQLQERSRIGRSATEPSYELPEPIDHVITALAQLSPNQRLAIVMHDYADRPTDEVARALNVSRATVFVHLSNGRKRLRRLLEGSREA